MVRSVTESEWDEQQQGWMLALAEFQALRCRGCGNNLAETTAKEGTFTWRTSRTRCIACTTLAEAQDAAMRDGKMRAPEAVLWRVEKR